MATKGFWYRYFHGEPLIGDKKTNATFWNRGTELLSGVDHAPISGRFEPSPWGHTVAALAGRVLPLKPLTGHGFTTGPAWRSGLERATARLVVPAGCTALHVAELDAWLYAGGAAAAAAIVANRVLHFVSHTERSLAPVMNEDGELVAPVWTPPGRKPKAKLPDVVRWADRVEYMRTLPEGVVYLGDQLVNGELVPLTHSFNGDAPHAAVSMSTGRGKSELYRSVLPQLIAQGADADIIDMKWISLHEFDGRPGVRIVRTIEGARSVISEFKAEMMARYEQLASVPKREHAALLATYKRRALVFEEMNTFSMLSKDYWLAEKQSSDPRTEPWMREWVQILAMARQVKMHGLMAGQRLDAKTIGDSSGNARDMVGAWVLSNPTVQTWKMAGGTGKPPTSNAKGRHVLKRGGSVTPYQGVFASSDDEVLDFMVTRSNVGTDVLDADLGQERGRPGGTPGSDLGQPQTLVTVRELAEQLGIGLEAARSRAKRGEFGEPVAKDPHGAGLYTAPSYDARTVVLDQD